MICNRAFLYKKINFVREFLISQDKKIRQTAPFNLVKYNITNQFSNQFYNISP